MGDAKAKSISGKRMCKGPVAGRSTTCSSLKKAQVAGPAGRSMMQDVAKEEEKARPCVGIIGDFENSCGQ